MVAGAALAAVGLLAGCTRDDEQPPAPEPTTTTAPAPPTVRVTASAQGDGSKGQLDQAARKATPELETFLTRYVTMAFDPAAARAGFQGFSEFFDPGLREQVVRDMASLSLGDGGTKVDQVETKPASARANLLIADGRPIAATVRLDVDGTARAGAAETPVSLRAVLQLERGGSGWRIVAYDAEATVPQ